MAANTAALFEGRAVMICERPTPQDLFKLPKSQHPFLSGCAISTHDPLGIGANKHKPIENKADVTPVLSKHKKWLRILRKGILKKLENQELTSKQVFKRRSLFRAFCESQRESVRKFIESKGAENKMVNEDGVSRIIGKSKNLPPEIKSKPAWAFTSETISNRNEETADELIGFASTLDFEKYVHDMEFRTALEVLRDRAGKIESDQIQIFEKLASAVNEERRMAAPPEEDTRVIQEVNHNIDRTNVGERFLEEDIGDSASQCQKSVPEHQETSDSFVEKILKEKVGVKKIHSKDSLKKVVSSALAPVIVDHNSPVLHVSPQNLPYIYRSPSI